MVIQLSLFIWYPPKTFLLSIKSLIMSFWYLKPITSIILFELIPNLFSDNTDNVLYHLLFLLFLHIALLGSFSHKYSKSSLYFSLTYLITFFACLLLKISTVLQYLNISFKIISYSSFILPKNAPDEVIISTNIYSSSIDKSTTFEILFWLDISMITLNLLSHIYFSNK